MKYDPTKTSHRRQLAVEIIERLEAAGFEEVRLPGTRELVFEFVHPRDDSVSVRIYTSIIVDWEGPTMRHVGKDAIRVIGWYIPANRGTRSITRVNRTGQIGVPPDKRGTPLDQRDTTGIANRVIARALSVYSTLLAMETVYEGERVPLRCRRCNAPLGLSRKGKAYCLDLCWKN